MIPVSPVLLKAGRSTLTDLSTARLRALLATIRSVIVLTHHLRKSRPDVVHVNSLKAGFIGGVAARLARRPLVWYVHDRISDDYMPRRTAALVRQAVRWLPHFVLANSESTLETLALGRTECAVAYPGLESTYFVDSVGPVPPGSARIGLIGRISPTKGQDVFLRAAAEVSKHHPDAEFLVAGAPLFDEQDFFEAIHAQALNLGIGDRVRFLGAVVDVKGLLLELTVAVHASPVPEPFGQVVVEAMAAGVPVVVTDAGGVSEILRAGEADSGELALRAAPGNAVDLAGAISRSIADPGAARKRAESALKTVRRRFTIEQTADAVMGAWEHASHQYDARERPDWRST